MLKKIRDKHVSAQKEANAKEAGAKEKTTGEELAIKADLLKAVAHAQSSFISGTVIGAVLEELLNTAVSVTGSEFGILGEVNYSSSSKPSIKIQAVTKIPWDKYPQVNRENFIHGMNSLFDVIIKGVVPVVSDSINNEIHNLPFIKSSCGFPLIYEGKVVGVLAFFNKPGGYNQTLINYIHTFTFACAQLIKANNDRTFKEEQEQYFVNTNELLNLHFNAKTRKEYIDGLSGFIRKLTKCANIGIRIRDSEDNVPYESFSGFSKEFYDKECWVSTKKDNCVCLRIVKGALDKYELPHATNQGSVCFSNLQTFARRIPPQNREKYRFECALMGFESLVLVPIRYNEEVIGLIQIADKQEGKILPVVIKYLESISSIIAKALAELKNKEEET